MKKFIEEFTFDIRDVIESFEELEGITDKDAEEIEEFDQIKSFLDEVRGNGGDENWRGDWYPLTFIDENYFTEYCQELVEECGELPKNLPRYIANNIDWEGVARELKYDYSSIDILGHTFYYR